jgi:hypothetical protein
MSIAVKRTQRERLSVAARGSILGGVITLFIDSYDIYLPALVLPAALDYFEPHAMSSTTKATLGTIVFTVTLLGRPIGGPIFGNLARQDRSKARGADRRCRVHDDDGADGMPARLRKLGVCVDRHVDPASPDRRIFLGGGYAGPIPLAIERAPKRIRGQVGGLVVTARRWHSS